MNHEFASIQRFAVVVGIGVMAFATSSQAGKVPITGPINEEGQSGGGGSGGGGGKGGCVGALMSPSTPFPFDPLPADAFANKARGRSNYLSIPSSGQTGIPVIDLTPRGLNAVSTSGPLVTASVNGHGGASTVFLGNGASYVDALDLNLPLNGYDWYHQRVFSSKSSSALDWQGEGWWGNEMIHVAVAGSEGASNVAVTFDPHYTLNFTYSAGSWTCDDKFLYTLTFSGGSDEYIITRIDGLKYVFHDSAATNANKLKRIEDAFGNDWAFTYSAGQLTDIVVDVVTGNDHKITYTYFTAGDNSGLLQYIKVYKSTTTASANLIAQIEHAYHATASDDYGLEDDLMKVIVSRKGTTDGDGILSITESYYYRYYKGAYDGSTNPGTDHQLKFVLNPENADRLTTALGDPLSQTNANFDDYANVYYKYDSNGRVKETQERLSGSGCGCGGAGGTPGITTYTWSVNGSSPDLDTWKIHCVADRADDTRVIFDVNRWYQILTWVVQNEDDGSPTKELVWHFDYGTSGDTENRMTAAWSPSAIVAYDESAPYGVTFADTEALPLPGMVHLIEYDTGTYARFPKKIRIDQVDAVTPDTLVQYARTISERPDLVTTITEYESTGEADGRSTTLSYTFYDGDKKQIKEIDTTYPSVSTGKNGPNSSAVEKRFYDKLTGAQRWMLDGEGYVLYVAYDDTTGMRNLAVVDANTSSLLAAIDNTWDGVSQGGLGADDTVPFSRTGSGSALDLDSSAVIDWLGRTRKTIDAGGMITYTVNKDDETRVYPAWNTGTYTTLLPIQVTKTDKEGRPEDVLTLKNSVTPSKDGGNEPTGTESYANADLAARTVHVYNISGSPESTDRYHYIPTSGDGSRYTNFYRTKHEYDNMGRSEYLIQDVADTSSYDTEQVTQSAYDFVGRLITRKEAVSGSGHDIGGGKPTMNTTTEYFYDTNSAGSQGVGDGLLRFERRWYGTSGGNYNDTQYNYDHRNRRIWTRPPVSPFGYVTYDNLDRVVISATYKTYGAIPLVANRLAYGKTYYDEWGRVYKTEKYDDPADSTPGDALVSHTYYDRRGLVVAADPANSGATETKYDGARRRTEVRQATGLESTKYSSDLFNYLDDDENIVQVTSYTLDDSGNATRVVSKELNHDDTDGIDLTNNDDYIQINICNYYDAAHRLSDTASYGTNHGSGWRYAAAVSCPGSVASRSDTVLVTTNSYDSSGRRSTVTDPKAIATVTTYDALGRTTAKLESSGGLNRKTEYEYNGQGSMTRIIADLDADNDPADGIWTIDGSDQDQVTEYAYADSINSRWVTEIRYPTGDGTVGSSQPDKIVFAYHLDGTLDGRTDQNGTVLDWTYDALRRKTEEKVTTVGSYSGGATAVDNAVRGLKWTYNDEGQTTKVTSYSDTALTSAVNEVKYTFNAADQLTKEEIEDTGVVVGGTSPAIEYDYATDYSTGYYNRRKWMKYPDGRKIWYGYTNSAGGSTFQDTINDKFNRVGQIARDSSGSIGDILAEYDFNGMGRFVRRVHDEGSGKYGNDTKSDLWHGTTGQYDGLDSFGRIVDLKHTDFSGSPVEFQRRKYTHDRDGNRLSIEDTIDKDNSQSFTYDNLNRLTDAKRGLLASNVVTASDVAENLNMDLLGNFTSAAGGIKLNGSTTNISHAINATNEITSMDRPAPAPGALLLKDDFTSSLSSFWSQNKGTWAISSNKVSVSTLTSSEAILLANTELDTINYEVEVTFPASSSTNKAGLIFAHDGFNNYYAVVFDRSTSKLAVRKVTGGSWGADLGAISFAPSDSTPYTLKVARKQSHLYIQVGGFSFAYDSATDFGVGQSGMFSDKTGVTFDTFKAYDAVVRDALVPRLGGLADSSLVSGQLSIAAGTRQAEAIVENFSDDDYMVQATVTPVEIGTFVWVRYSDANNGYRFRFAHTTKFGWQLHLYSVKNGVMTLIETKNFTNTLIPTPVAFKVKLAGSSIKTWVDGTLKHDLSDSDHLSGRVAFGGDYSKFDDLKIGYDNNSDDDIDDGGDDVVVSDTFGSTMTSIAYDDAGNLIDDGNFVYVYDAWNRLVKVRSSADADKVIQTAKYDGTGRRIQKVVSNSGDLDGTFVYNYETGWKIAQVSDGSNVMKQQYIHGTQYIDEVVMMRAKDKGDLYLHQDANWNVLAATDLGGSIVERYIYTPYGELTVHQSTSYGDRDGDGDVDATDKGTPGTDCTGTVSGACRIIDLDFDADYDATDTTKFDNDTMIPKGLARSSGQPSTAVTQPFVHQGLYFDSELNNHQNRARAYISSSRRFQQRDPLGAITSNSCIELCNLHVTACNLICGAEISCQYCEQIASHCTQGCAQSGGPITNTSWEELTGWIGEISGGGRGISPNYYSYLSSSPPNRIDPMGLLDCGQDGCRPGYSPNGCGEEWLNVPDVIGGVNLSGCCNTHDRCYSCCCCPPQMRQQCESAFGSCMRNQCGGNALCNIAASIYNFFTSFFGQFAFKPSC